MTTKLEAFLNPRIFRSAKIIPLALSSFSYPEELEELKDLAGEDYTEMKMKAALMKAKGDLDSAYELLLEEDESLLCLPQEEEQKTEPESKNHFILVSLLKEETQRKSSLGDLLPPLKVKEQIQFSGFGERLWFEAKTALQAKWDKQAPTQVMRVVNYSHFKKAFQK